MNNLTIIGQALDNMRALTGMKAAFIPPLRGEKTDGHFYFGKPKQRLPVAIKNEVRAVPGNLTPAFKKHGAVLVAGYITPKVKEQLKENGINYLDAAGNCFIRYRDIFIFIDGRKVAAVREKPDGKLWTAPGLKYTWAILQNPALVNQTYRLQAATAGVALGRIGDFITELENNEYLTAGKDGWVIEKRQDLEERWMELYPRVLKPKLFMGAFRFARQTIPDKLPKEMLWGAEPAAAGYTKFLQPEIYAIYTWTDRETTMKKLQLLPDPNGRVLLYEGFWPRPFDGTEFVPVQIVYAELMGTGDSRNIEAAQRIKQL